MTKSFLVKAFLHFIILLILIKRAATVLGDRLWPTVAGIIAVLLAPAMVILIRRELARRRMIRWAATAGWTTVEPASRDWPWQTLLLRGKTQVKRAWTHEVNSLPVTAGEIRWFDRALEGAVPVREGRGIFVVVRLPLPAPPMALRIPYRLIGDSHRLTQPALRQALLNGEIPTWTVRGDELFTFEAQYRRLTPDAMDRAVRRALRTVEVLDLGPDITCTDDESPPDSPAGSVEKRH